MNSLSLKWTLLRWNERLPLEKAWKSHKQHEIMVTALTVCGNNLHQWKIIMIISANLADAVVALFLHAGERFHSEFLHPDTAATATTTASTNVWQTRSGQIRMPFCTVWRGFHYFQANDLGTPKRPNSFQMEYTSIRIRSRTRTDTPEKLQGTVSTRDASPTAKMHSVLHNSQLLRRAGWLDGWRACSFFIYTCIFASPFLA